MEENVVEFIEEEPEEATEEVDPDMIHGDGTLDQEDNKHESSEEEALSYEPEAETNNDTTEDKPKEERADDNSDTQEKEPAETPLTTAQAPPPMPMPIRTSISSRTASGLSTASSTKSSVVSTSVTPDRKQKLLLEARRERLEWIEKVSLPYLVEKQFEEQDARFALLQKSRVAVQAPSVTKILTLLYEDNNEMADNIPQLLQQVGTTPHDLERAIPSGTEVLSAEVQKYENDKHMHDLVVEYQDLLLKLKSPQCAMLVQGMRNFCRHSCLQTSIDRDNQSDTEETLASKLATTLNNYIHATQAAIQSHPAWTSPQENDKPSTTCLHSLESFLYGHVRSHVYDILLQDGDIQTAHDEWMERLTLLKFITPKHLELDCFAQDDNDMMDHVEELLKEPMEILLTVDQFHSPYEKVQRILHVYHGVNAALTSALNKNQSNDNNNKVLPSADHVLPTLILVVLLAQPPNMILNLHYIEVYCPPEYLRGEAGYAFTNLYGAIQFIRDLNLDSTQEERNTSLMISPQEFQQKLQECREATKEKEKSVQTQETKPKSPPTMSLSPTPPDISASQIRNALLRGDDVNVEWAMKQWEETNETANGTHVATNGMTHTNGGDDRNGSERAPKNGSDSVPFVQQAAALSKSYSFLTTRPEDVKVSDLPQLLAEYRTLVHTTEVLLAERTAKLASDRKRQLAKERQALEENMQQL